MRESGSLIRGAACPAGLESDLQAPSRTAPQRALYLSRRSGDGAQERLTGEERRGGMEWRGRENGEESGDGDKGKFLHHHTLSPFFLFCDKQLTCQYIGSTSQPISN